MQVIFTKIFNYCVKSANVPDILKYTDIAPLFIGQAKTTISTLSTFLKIFENIGYIIKSIQATKTQNPSYKNIKQASGKTRKPRMIF